MSSSQRLSKLIPTGLGSSPKRRRDSSSFEVSSFRAKRRATGQLSGPEEAAPRTDGTRYAKNEPSHYSSGTGELCARCAALDIDALFRRRRTRGVARHLVNLGKLGPQVTSSSCPLCALFDWVKIHDIDGSDQDEYALYSTQPPNPFYEFGAVLAVISTADKHLQRSARNIGEAGGDIGFIALAPSPGYKLPSAALKARSIDSRSIDFDIVKQWIASCRETHLRKCENIDVETSRPRSLRLIDCEQRRVIRPTASVEYTALSYVWGANGSDDDDRLSGDKLPQALPQTIEDALTVTKALGLRYLWIDRYCVNQYDEHEKKIQIQQMDLVYRNAHITIIAAAGDDPHFGLPGVSQTPRTQQPEAWVGDKHLVSILPDPKSIIQTSTWMTRAWTMQENFFSRRRLVFTEQQVYYECRTGMAYETVDAFPASDFYRLFGDTNHYDDLPWEICSLLGRYSGRELSYEDDAIRAFEGVFHDFRNREFPVHQYFGVPVMPPVIRGSSGLSQTSDHSRSEGFIAGLCWRNEGPGVRRAQFPSWSWAGFTAPLTGWMPECSDGLKLGGERRPKVFVEGLDGSLLDFEDAPSLAKADDHHHHHHHHQHQSASRFIHLEAWTVPLAVRYMPGTHDWVRDFRSQTAWSDNISGHFACFEDAGSCLQIALYSLRQTYEEGAEERDFAPDSGKGEILGVVLGRCEDVSQLASAEGIFIMIVQNVGSHFERIGHMEYKTALMRTTIDSAKGQSDLESWQLCFRDKKRRRVRLG